MKWPGAGSWGWKAGASNKGLSFARWSGADAGQWGAERAVFTGADGVQCYAADEGENGLIGRSSPMHVGSGKVILAPFAASDFAMPPLRLTPPNLDCAAACWRGRD